MRGGVLWTVSFAAASLAADDPKLLDIDSREVVLRIYREKPRGNTEDFVTRKLRIEGRTIKLDFPDIDYPARVKILSEDQNDEVLRLAIGDRRYSAIYRRRQQCYLHIEPCVLSGRTIVVRVYRYWRENPEQYDKLTAAVFGRHATLEFDDVDESAVAAIFGQDQEDELLKQLIGYWVYGWAYKPALRFSLPDEAPPDSNDFCWTFIDALGNPLRNAAVQLYLQHSDRRVLIDQGTVDSKGQWRTRFQIRHGHGGGFGTTCHLFVLSHPHYGVAEARVYKTNRRRDLVVVLPFIPPGSGAYQRCAWGVVVDPDDRPVSDALVRGHSLRPPGNDWIEGSSYCCVRTDRRGRFRLYIQVAPSNQTIGSLIPPMSQYSITVTPPRDLGLVEYRGEIPNGQASTIRLEHRTGYFHTFAFEDENGPITDRNLFYVTRIKIRRPEARDLYLKYEDWKDGGLFPPGKYEAEISGGKDYRFEPIEVTAESPEQIVFEPPSSPPKFYYGRVVHGIIREPMEGVCVKDLTSGPRRRNDPTRKSHTDKTGRFELKRPGHIRAYKFEVSEPNYLAVLIENDLFKEDSNGNFELPLTRMFPAAKVVVDLWVDENYFKEQERPRYPDFWPEWIVDANINPPWAKDLLAACIDDYHEGISRDYGLDTRAGPRSFYVPAELNFQLQFRPWMRVYPCQTDWAPMTFPHSINLRQGEVLDLGRVEIKRALTLFVELTDSTGQPREGVPVTACDQYGRATSNTGEDGFAVFKLAHDSKGQLVVESPSKAAEMPRLRQTIPYEITGPEDANTVYTIQLSDKMLESLFE
jgi:hypothetical protein